MDSAKAKVSSFFSPLLKFTDDAKERFDKLVSTFTNFKMPKIKLPSMPSSSSCLSKLTGSGDSGHRSVDDTAYHGENRVPRDGMLYRLYRTS